MKSLGTLAAFAPILPLSAADNGKLRGDRVGWARLKTESEWWMRHANGDPTLTHFLRDHTTLNIAPDWYVADVQNLEQMCGYPLLFSQSIEVVKDARGKANVIEYMKRSGFMLIDACCNLNINPNHDQFLEQHIAYLKEILPEAKVTLLPNDHPVYRCIFTIPNGHPPHTFFNNAYDARKDQHGLYSITMNERMLGMISLSGLQCGWSPLGVMPPAGHDIACMKMLVNIYVYAMLQRG